MSKKQTIYIFFVKICLSFQNLLIKVTSGFELWWSIQWREGWGTNYKVGPGQFFISSPELKALLGVFDRNLSVVRRRCRCCCCHRLRCKLFTFLSSSKKPLGQFQPNLAQNILRWRGFKFVKMKGHALVQEEIIWKYREI